MSATQGSIPACAGETQHPGRVECRGGVYPRVCGGNDIVPGSSIVRKGLSPRVRGKPSTRAALNAGVGSIPACAGETSSTDSDFAAAEVYPRVCGGNGSQNFVTAAADGLSPRVRGKRAGTGLPAASKRSIPACAGETYQFVTAGQVNGVYPRVCGGNQHEATALVTTDGLSPRVRGKPAYRLYHAGPIRSIPACAGETRQISPPNPTKEVYPRVCGGNMLAKVWREADGGLSPRVRGKPDTTDICRIAAGSIPACAGETARLHSEILCAEVYPRVCGGNAYRSPDSQATKGLSPRVRGKPLPGDRLYRGLVVFD